MASSRVMASKGLQRLIGVIMLIAGIGLTAQGWQSVMVDGMYRPKAAFFLPVIAFLGLAVALYPMTKEECLARYGVEKPQSWSHFAPMQKVLAAAGVAAGLLNWALISGTLSL